MSKVAIITTHYKNTVLFKQRIEQLLKKTINVDFNWYIWTNGIDEEQKNILSLIKDNRVKIYNHPDNKGNFSANNNACIRRSNEEFILLLNDDICPINNNWLEKMLNIIEKDDKVGVVGACLLYPNGLIQHAGVYFPAFTNGLPFHIYYRQQQNKEIIYNREYKAVTGACMLFRREDWDKVGGLDERYYYNFEDISLCLDIGSLGKKNIYCGEVKLIHYEGISGNKQSQEITNKNVAIFRSKHKVDSDDTKYSNKSYGLYRGRM